MTKIIKQIEESMTIKLIGLGGQGVVTAAALLARAAFHQGWWSQSMPFFGVERTGTPVEAYVRLAKQPVRNHQKIDRSDILLVNDYQLYQANDDGRLLTIVNQPETLAYQADQHRLFYDSRQLSRLIFNQDLAIGLLGALSAAWPLITELNWLKAINEQFADEAVIEKNIQAFLANYELAAKIIKQHEK